MKWNANNKAKKISNGEVLFFQKNIERFLFLYEDLRRLVTQNREKLGLYENPDIEGLIRVKDFMGENIIEFIENFEGNVDTVLEQRSALINDIKVTEKNKDVIGYVKSVFLNLLLVAKDMHEFPNYKEIMNILRRHSYYVNGHDLFCGDLEREEYYDKYFKEEEK